MTQFQRQASQYHGNILKSGKSIYDPIDQGDEKLWIPAPILENLLNSKLVGLSLTGLPLRTRSKVLKEKMCDALGYPIPKNFAKTQPRFQGQDFDTYIQKSNNLQIWNEEISPTRRYVIIRLSQEDIVRKVKVVSGQEIALLDKTGTLTRKYQARLNNIKSATELIVSEDTPTLLSFGVDQNKSIDSSSNPTDLPQEKSLLPINTLFEKISVLVGKNIPIVGRDQERNRGAGLHSIVCRKLGYKSYQDNGKFPDLLNQLLEIKMQTSPTIDLGLVSPDSKENLDIPAVNSHHFRHNDVRYAIFYGVVQGSKVKLTNFFLTNGKNFYKRFPKFQGRVINAKIQIPLPNDFFR